MYKCVCVEKGLTPKPCVTDSIFLAVMYNVYLSSFSLSLSLSLSFSILIFPPASYFSNSLTRIETRMSRERVSRIPTLSSLYPFSLHPRDFRSLYTRRTISLFSSVSSFSLRRRGLAWNSCFFRLLALSFSFYYGYLTYLPVVLRDSMYIV